MTEARKALDPKALEAARDLTPKPMWPVVEEGIAAYLAAAPQEAGGVRAEPVAWRYRMPNMDGAQWMIVQGAWPSHWDTSWEREPLYAAPVSAPSPSVVEALTEQIADDERSMRSSLAALAAAQTAPGWRLVPVEPTDEMLEAGEEEIQERHALGCGTYASDIYRAMIAASPSTTETQGG